MSIDDLVSHESHWPTRMGKAFLCERVVMRGRDLHQDLARMDWFRLHLFSVTGREFSNAQVEILNFMWVVTSYPDPSIWPNLVAALGGTARSTPSMSLVAGISVSEAAIYGRRPERKVLDFFYRLSSAIDQGSSLEAFIEQEIKIRKIVCGYGRPLAKLDERIPYTLEKVEALGLQHGRHFRLALDVYRYLKKTRGLSMNIAAVNTGLIADMGFTPEQYQLFLTPCFISGMIPCYIEAKEKQEGAFFPVRCENIVYQGPPSRKWPA